MVRRMGTSSRGGPSGLLATGRNTILPVSNITVLWHNLSGLGDTWVAMGTHRGITSHLLQAW